MKFYRNPLWMATLLIFVFLFACVTINIYFPAEKVKSAAGEIVNDIRGEKSGNEEKSLKNEKNSLLRKTFLVLSPSSVAWAEDAATVSNPTIRALKEKMKGRYNLMKPYYQKRMLKEGDDGYVSLGNTQGLGLKGKRDLKNLVDAENKDRKRLYQEVAKALKIDPSQINKIAEIFSKEWQKSVR
ncbi:MAG: DUF1318 domain-containing protein [Deltaproteobacteria bacterium]|nr:DUF1318 domain-containing protein [Deltaproteobacteria bacterium]MBW2305946.1 DUF1318 domain-containing protein [Deltaproteobacteria bacterium]